MHGRGSFFVGQLRRFSISILLSVLQPDRADRFGDRRDVPAHVAACQRQLPQRISAGPFEASASFKELS